MTSIGNNCVFKNITVSKPQAMLQQGGLRLFDVRTKAEMAHGKIPKGESLLLHLLPLRLSTMDKNATTVFYCRMGGRSEQNATIASANEFVEVYNLQGGITAWKHAGFPIPS